jgi:hypothetical protein
MMSSHTARHTRFSKAAVARSTPRPAGANDEMRRGVNTPFTVPRFESHVNASAERLS